MSAPLGNPPPDVVVALAEENLGPMLIGLAVTAALWGVACTQTYWYWMHFKNDKVFLRYFIILIWILDTFDLILSYRFLYFYAIQSFGNFPLEVIKPWEFSLEYLTSSVIMFAIQLLFVSKLWQLFAKHAMRPLLLIIVAVGAVAFGAGLGQSIRGFMHPVEPITPATIDKILPDIQQVALVVTDIAIMVLLSTALLFKRTGMKRTDSMIANLVLFAVTQGVLTSLFQFLALITYVTMPAKLIWFAFRYPGLQIYVNTALASLNTRNWIREQAFTRPYHQSLNTELLGPPWPTNTNFSQPRTTDSYLDSHSTTVPARVHILKTTEVIDGNGFGDLHLAEMPERKVSNESMPSNV